MLEDKLRDVNIAGIRKLPAPKKIAEDTPADDSVREVVFRGRE